MRLRSSSCSEAPPCPSRSPRASIPCPTSAERPRWSPSQECELRVCLHHWSNYAGASSEAAHNASTDSIFSEAGACPSRNTQVLAPSRSFYSGIQCLANFFTSHIKRLRESMFSISILRNQTKSSGQGYKKTAATASSISARNRRTF